MVVTRKTQAVPPPPNSRTTSSQTKGKSQPSKPQQTPSQSPPQAQPQKQSKQKQKSQLKPKPKRVSAGQPSLLSRLFTLLFTLLAFHTLTTCPSDTALKSPVCRSLATYRHAVIEPYILPPIASALSSPSIQPYIHDVKLKSAPYITQIQRAEKTLRPYTRRAGQYFNAASLSIYYKFILPTYRLYVVPNYNTHLHPYVRRAKPYVTPIYQHVVATGHKATPYLQRAYDATQPIVLKSYLTAKPRVLAAWAQVKPYLCVAWTRFKVELGKAVGKLGELRREFVDPPLMKIWDKVVESEAASASSSLSAAETATPVPEPEPTPKAATVEKVVTSTTAPTVADVPTGQVDEQPAVDAMSSAASVVEASLGETTQNVVPTPVAEPEVMHFIPGAAAQEVTSDEGDIAEEEIDDFLRELGVGSDDENVTEPPSQEQESPQVEEQLQTEHVETPEEKLARVAAQRHEIVTRHVAWQAQIDEAVVVGRKAFIEWLHDFRWGAVGFLERKEGGRQLVAIDEVRPAPDAAETKGKGWVAGEKGLQGEGERLLKGLDGYLKKATKRVKSAIEASKGDEKSEAVRTLKADEAQKWGEVVGKVEVRFSEKVIDVQGEVHHWYVGIREEEVQKVLQDEYQLKTLAEKAQSDIGMDYAWLDDVSHWDWKKYHILMSTAVEFANDLRAIQNGTQSTPETTPDPLILALDALQQDMEDLVDGFEVGLARVKEDARKVLSVAQEGGDEPVVDDEPELVIQPIEPQVPIGDGDEGSEGLKEAAKVVLGRGKEEVEKAFERAGAVVGGRDEL